MQYLARGASNPLYARSYTQTHGGKVGIMVINSQKGRTSSLAPKVSEAMDNQLPHEISGRHAELGLCSGEMMKCKYKGNRRQHL
jgi:hypothetical protein